MKEFYNKAGITIFHEDNLAVLRSLSDKSINLIYCDILYNTGKNFDDYNDDLGNPDEAIAWYRPRIEEMKRVLADNGSIFIHCNWRMDSYMRILMDEIFGTACFRNRIYRQHSEERGFYSNFDSQVDIILYYVKNPNDFVFNEIRDSKTRIVPLFENGFIESKSVPYIFKGEEIDLKVDNKHWLISKAQFENMVKNNEIILKDGLPYRVSNVKPIGNLWDEPEMFDSYDRTKLAEAYDTPKPEAVLDRIITMCSNEGDMVADFFMGGGTTAVVAKKLNRRGVFCDISEKACNITVSKIEKL